MALHFSDKNLDTIYLECHTMHRRQSRIALTKKKQQQQQQTNKRCQNALTLKGIISVRTKYAV